MANKIIIMITVVLATCSFFVGCGKDNSVQLSGESCNESVLESGSKKQETKNDNIYVYVNGQVKYPGVYKLKNGDRAYKAIKKAGGLTKNAKKNNINLAETVVDAQNIYVMSYIPDTAYHKPLHYLGLVYKPHREPFQVFLRLHLHF